MKRPFIVATIVFWYASSSAQEADIADKQHAPLGEKQAAKADTAEFEVRKETSEGLIKYFRRDQLVLSCSVAHPDLCYVRGPEGLYAMVILNKPTSPRIGIHEHLERINLEIERIDANTLKLLVIDPETGYIDAYVLTPTKIAPISAAEYSRLFAEWKAIQEGFGLPVNSRDAKNPDKVEPADN